MKKMLFVLLIIGIMTLAACDTGSQHSNQGQGKGGNGGGLQQLDVSHEETHIQDLPVEDISQAELDALNQTINDEYKARAIYSKVIAKFGDIKPFSNIINAETTHASELTQLYIKYDLDVPVDDWESKVPEFETVSDACAAAVQAEIDNAALYDELLSNVDNQDIIAVFTSLRDASLNKHLPAFERCGGNR